MNRHPRTPPRRRPRAVLPVVVTALVAALLLAWSAPAGAHGGPGKLDLVSATTSPDGAAIDITVRLTYAGDGDPVEEATVTVSGTGPGDVRLTPVTMEPIAPAGTFFATVAVPEQGEWSLRLTSVEPEATLEVPPQQVGDSAGGAGVIPTVGDQAVSSTAPAPTTTVGATTTAQAADGEDAPEEGSNVVVSLLVGVAAGLVVIGAGALWRRRRAGGSA